MTDAREEKSMASAGFDPATSAVEHPKVSLIVPMYNVHEDVAECIESLLAQSRKDIQVIFVDDGSTDDTGDIARRYAGAYPNLEYHRIENQGLGHARNYGVSFARGEWLMFPDSDDVLEPYAVEEMVELGERHGCDIVSGDVVRFNTKEQFDSGLHRRAFRAMPEVTHITNNPDLLYDSTAWNKIYRRDFYLRENIQWTEGRLYEDIPVTAPAHYKANKVAFLDKVVYRWRVRDGQGASITQRRTEIDNFRDRMYAIQKVDEFFDANVRDDALRLAKDVKWLELDLIIYVDVLDRADEAFQNEVMDFMRSYLTRIDPRAFELTNALNRVKYHYIQRGDLPQLLRVLRYWRTAMDTLNIVRKGDRLVGRFPFRGLSSRECDMTRELRELGLWTKIDAVKLDDEALSVDLSAVVRPLTQQQVTLDAYLVDEEGRRVAPFEVTGHQAARSLEVLNNREFKKVLVKRQPLRDFTLAMPAGMFAHLTPGRYRIELDYRDGSLRLDPVRLAGPVEGSAPRPLPRTAGESLMAITYDQRHQLIVSITAQPRLLEAAELGEDDVLTISLTDGTSESLALPKGLQEGASHSFEGVYYPSEPQCFFVRKTRYALDADDLAQVTLEELMGVGELGFGTESREDDGQLVALRRSELWRIGPDGRGVAVANRVVPGVVATSIVTDVAAGTLSMSLSCPYEEELEVRQALLVGERFGAEVPMTLDATDATAWSLTFAFSDPAQVELLRDDRYDLMVDVYNAAGKPCRLKVFSGLAQLDLSEVFVCDGYRYELSCPDGVLSVSVARERTFYEGRLREQLVERGVYPMLRRLPLKKNLILFESYWGRSVDCNPKALYDYINREHPEYECVWSVVDPRIPVEGNATKVIRGTLPFYQVAAQAKYLVNNVNFCDEYEKKPGQIEIQTMHGTPLKTLGLDVKADFPDQATVDGFLRRCGRWDYLIVQSPKVEEITASCYAYDRAYLRTGYPRNDELIRRNTPEEQRRLKERLGADPNKKLVLYAPTWRVSERFDLELDFARLSLELGDDYVFALRRHHLALPGFTNRSLMGPALDFTYEKSIDDLLLAADIVITDYSSLMFDYALLDRPMLFYVYDLEAYRDELRGFNIDLTTEAPGPLLRTTEEVLEVLRLGDEGMTAYGEAYCAFKEKFLTYESDHSSRDVFEQVMGAQL